MSVFEIKIFFTESLEIEIAEPYIEKGVREAQMSDFDR